MGSVKRIEFVFRIYPDIRRLPGMLRCPEASERDEALPCLGTFYRAEQ